MSLQIATGSSERSTDGYPQTLDGVSFTLPTLEGHSQDIPLHVGKPVFVIGPNGSGKSSLLQKLYTENHGRAIRVTAHRQTWLESNTINLTPRLKVETDQYIAADDTQNESRWRDQYASQRVAVTLFELIDAEIARAMRIQSAVDSRDATQTEKLRQELSPLSRLNGLLELGNLPITISIEENQQLFASKQNNRPYSIAELSDGERNAVLLAANVLTAKPNTLILIDEPERHLHRSIASPLLISLFEERPDCAFVVSTHDVSLPIDIPNATTLLLRSCTWSGNSVTAWDADIVSAETGIGDDTRREILGSRRKILFVEGDYGSLDRHTYAILYSDISVVPKGNCTEVHRAVTGIRNSEDLHWVKAHGLIDRDNRTEEVTEELAAQGTFALDCYSIESLYYSSEIISRIADRQLEVSPDHADLSKAENSIVEEVSKHKDRLCALLIEKRLRNEIESQLPTHESLIESPIHCIRLDATEMLIQEGQTFDRMVLNKDTDGLIDRYNVATTRALDSAAKHLGFRGRENYENAVMKLLADDEAARELLRQRLSKLTQAIATND